MALPLKRNRKFVFVLSLRPQTCTRHGGVYREIQQEIQPCPRADCLRLIGLMERRVFCKGECVVRQGERNSDFYVVSRGIWLGTLSRRRRGCLGLVRRRGARRSFRRGVTWATRFRKSPSRRCATPNFTASPKPTWRPFSPDRPERPISGGGFRGAVPGARKLDALGRVRGPRALPDTDGGKPRTAAIRAAEAHRLLPLDHAAVVEPHPGQTGEEKRLTKEGVGL